MSGPLASGSNATVTMSGFDPPQLGDDRRDVLVHRGLFGEDVARVEAQPQVADVLALPAEIAPEALGLPLAAHPLELLDVLGVLLAGIGLDEVILQLGDAAVHVLQEVLAEQLDQVAQHPAGAALGLLVLVPGGHAVEVLPDVAVALDGVALGEVALFQQGFELRRCRGSGAGSRSGPA